MKPPSSPTKPSRVETPAPLALAPIVAQPAHHEGGDAAALSAINDLPKNIAVWRRKPPGHDPALVTAWALRIPRREWIFEDLAEPDCGLQRFDVNDALHDLPAGPDRSFLHEDVTSLLQRFRALLLGPRGLFEDDVNRSPGRHVLVRFAGITDDACRKFHSDRVSLRLITTYVGPGTEWLTEGHVWRADPRELPNCVHAANALIAPHPEHIERNSPGDVAILKGLTHPHVVSGHVPAIVHRSPPIGGSGVARVVVTITAELGAH